MRAGVIELVAFEVDFRSPEMLGQPLSEIQRRGPAHVVRPEILHRRRERRVRLRLAVRALEIEHERHQGFGDKPPPVLAEAALGIGQVLPVAASVHGRGLDFDSGQELGDQEGVL